MGPALPGFEIIKKLGGGSVSDVFLVRSTLTQHESVLKLLRPELVSDDAVVGRFLDEAKICQTLDHPNVVKHLGVSRTSDGGLYILTHYVEGMDLARHLHTFGPLTAEQLLGLAPPLCEALGYIHDRGIVHRDLKPSNIFLAGGLAENKPMLIDFGVARFDGHRVRTQMGMVLTTPEYAAPELVRGDQADHRTDIYALGIVMFESLVGHPPFTDPVPANLLKMHLEASPGPLPTGAAALEPIVQRCLEKDPNRRFQSAREVAQALVEATDMLNTSNFSDTGQPIQLNVRAASAETGDVLGNYKIERLLGEGGMGQVFLATHVRLGRHVAIKILRPEHSGRQDVVARFFQEARSVNRINHEHIIEVHDFVEDKAPDGSPRAYCVMELLAGKTLRAAMDEGPMSLQRLVNIARQICGSLGAAHKLEIVHRDVKPENVFLAQRSGIQDFVKVLDFGMAKFQLAPGELNHASTLQGLIIGTPAYMAPEQVNGAATDARTDIYALGVVLYEILTGKPPFEAASIMPLFMKICSQQPAPVGATMRSGEVTPASLASLVMRCLEKKPEMRPQRIDEVEEVLMGLTRATVMERMPTPASGGFPAAVAPEQALARSMASRKRWAMVGIAAAALLLVGLGAVAFFGRGPAPAPVAVPVAPPPPGPAAAVADPAPAPPQMVTLRLSSTPSGATVLRTDSNERLGTTPLVRQVPTVTGSEVGFRFELPKHKSADRSVSLARDVSLDVTLTPEQAEAPAKARPSRANRHTTKDDLVDPLAP